MIDWQNMTWQPGDTAEYHDMATGTAPQHIKVHAGLYWYSGLGCGHLFRPDGTMTWCSPQEANAEAKKLGVEMRYVDSFINIGRATSIGDR